MNYIEYAVCFVFNDANIRYTPILFTTGMMTLYQTKPRYYHHRHQNLVHSLLCDV